MAKTWDYGESSDVVIQAIIKPNSFAVHTDQAPYGESRGLFRPLKLVKAHPASE